MSVCTFLSSFYRFTLKISLRVRLIRERLILLLLLTHILVFSYSLACPIQQVLLALNHPPPLSIIERVTTLRVTSGKLTGLDESPTTFDSETLIVSYRFLDRRLRNSTGLRFKLRDI